MGIIPFICQRLLQMFIYSRDQGSSCNGLVSNILDYLNFWNGHRLLSHGNNLIQMSKIITNVYLW